MSDSTHQGLAVTTGPWYYDGPNKQGAHIIHVAEGEIAEVFSEWLPIEDIEFNARLVAAAPELLAALKQAVRALNEVPSFRIGHHRERNSSYKVAAICDAAIAKVYAPNTNPPKP